VTAEALGYPGRPCAKGPSGHGRETHPGSFCFCTIPSPHACSGSAPQQGGRCTLLAAIPDTDHQLLRPWPAHRPLTGGAVGSRPHAGTAPICGCPARPGAAPRQSGGCILLAASSRRPTARGCPPPVSPVAGPSAASRRRCRQSPTCRDRADLRLSRAARSGAAAERRMPFAGGDLEASDSPPMPVASVAGGRPIGR
jgi:hypothetical protein